VVWCDNANSRQHAVNADSNRRGDSEKAPKKRTRFQLLRAFSDDLVAEFTTLVLLEAAADWV
jgi:hypothetical protein